VITNLAEIRARHARFLRQHDLMVEAELAKGAAAGVQYSRDHTGFQNQTGKTAHATEGQVIRSSRGHLLRLKTGSKIGRFMDQGTKAHPIKAKRGLLHFYWGKVGRWVHAKRVQHPGTRAYQFIRTGHRYGAARAMQGIKSMMSTLARNF
jgi:hypothetical protein